MGFRDPATPEMNQLNLKMKQLFALSIAAVLSLCSVQADTITLNASGATFPAPLYGRWFAEYNQLIPTCRSITRASAAARASSRSPAA